MNHRTVSFLSSWALVFLIFAGCAILPGKPVRAQELDRGFAPPLLWERFTDYTFSRGPYRSFADGQGGVLLVGNGGADVVAGEWRREPIRLREADGTVDATFQSDASGGWATAIQPDGRIVLTGSTGGADVVYRLLPSGTLDPSFTPIAFSQGIRHLTVLPGGKILVVVWGNYFGNPSPWAIPVPDPTVFRLHASGRVDTSFRRPALQGSISLFAPPISDAAGRIYLGGQFTGVNNVPRANVVRLLPNGEVDESFAGSLTVPGGLGGRVRGVELQSDGRLIVAGDLRIPSTALSRDRIAAIRFDAGGRFDESFTRHKVVDLGLGDYPRSIVLQPDDKFVAVSAWLRRFNPDGTVDSQFAGANFSSSAFWLTRLSDGRFLVPGANSAEGVAVFSADGTPDLTFKTGGFGRACFPANHAVLSDGRLAVSGQFNRVGSQPQLGLALLDPVTGAAPSPQPDLAPFAPEQAVMDYSGGAIEVAAGPTNTLWFLASVMDTAYASRTFFGRTLASGAFDPAIPVREISSPSPLAGATELEPLPDGRLLVVANSAQAVVDENPLRRLLPDGVGDPAFAGLEPRLRNQLGRVTYAFDGSFERIEMGWLQILGRVGGDRLLASVNTVDGEAHVVRIDADGRGDESFSAPVVSGLQSGFDYGEVRNPRTGLVEQPWEGTLVFQDEVFRQAAELRDGSVLVAGSFYELDGMPVAHLARLTREGRLDSTFPGVNLDYLQSPFVEPEIHAIQVDELGRTYVAGVFDHINRHPALGLARLLPDGSVDETFQSPFEVSPAAYQQAELRLMGNFLYVFGDFTDGQSRRMIWRLRVAEELALSWQSEAGKPLALSVPASPTTPTVVQASEDLLEWRDVFTNPAGAPATVFTDPEAGSQRQRFYRLKR